MGEYTRDDEHQIYRDFANRLGKLAAQYQQIRGSFADNENYGATLTIALLHPLLTIYTELRRRNSRVRLNNSLRDIPDSYGIRLNMVKSFSCYDKFPRKEDMTFDFVLESIRHALSHPCPILDEQHQRTGYETVEGQSGFIEKFRFVQSSDQFSKNDAESILNRISEQNENSDIMMSPVQSRHNTPPNKFHLIDLAGERFIRKLVIEVPLDALKTLVSGLSEYLGRPISEMMTLQFNGPRLARARR